MEHPCACFPPESEIRFLEYRLDVISHWPASGLKQATAEAISRRLTSIGRATLSSPHVGDLLATSCRLLDHVFEATAADAWHPGA